MNTKAMNPKAMNTESLTEDDALTEASARLQTLILRRAEGNSRLQKRLRRDMRQASFALPPRPAYKARLLQAALVIVKSVYAYSWEDLQAILDNRAGRDTSLREAVRRQEADRLLVQRLMTAERKLDFVISRSRSRGAEESWPEGTRGLQLTEETLQTWSREDPARQAVGQHTPRPGDILFVAPGPDGHCFALLSGGEWRITGTLKGILQSA